MLDINGIYQKAQAERTDTSVMFEIEKQPAKAKITIEMPGQDPVVFNEVDEHIVFTRSGQQVGAVSVATLPFLMYVLNELKEKVNQAISNIASKFL